MPLYFCFPTRAAETTTDASRAIKRNISHAARSRERTTATSRDPAELNEVTSLGKVGKSPTPPVTLPVSLCTTPTAGARSHYCTHKSQCRMFRRETAHPASPSSVGRPLLHPRFARFRSLPHLRRAAVNFSSCLPPSSRAKGRAETPSTSPGCTNLCAGTRRVSFTSAACVYSAEGCRKALRISRDVSPLVTASLCPARVAFYIAFTRTKSRRMMTRETKRDDARESHGDA